MSKRFWPNVIIALYWTACGSPEATPWGEANPRAEVRPTEWVAVQSSAGRHLGVVPIASRAMDRVEVDLSHREDRALVVIAHGQEGGSSLYLLAPGNSAQLLLRTPVDRSLSRPVWSLEGNCFAYALRSPATWVGASARLQFRGELWRRCLDGTVTRESTLTDVAAVWGWLDAKRMVVGRYAPGDLAPQRPFVFDREQQTVRPLDADHPKRFYYNAAWVGDALFVARTAEPVVTLPRAEQLVEVVRMDESGRALVVARETGHLPTGFWSCGSGQVCYQLEGSQTRRQARWTPDRGTTQSRARRPVLEWSEPETPVDVARGIAGVMPFVHQLYDTHQPTEPAPYTFDGGWACGPTSTLMALCFFGRLDPLPITVDTPTPHTSDFGAYVSEEYTAFGHTFDRLEYDRSGNPVHGGYGWCTENGDAWAWRMQDYARHHVLFSDFESAPSFSLVQDALDAGKIVVVSTGLTGAGHIVVARDYSLTSSTLYVNDPYGNAHLGYPNEDGEFVPYTWAELGTGTRWLITVYPPCHLIEPKETVLADDGPCFEKQGPSEYWRDSVEGHLGHVFWTTTIDNGGSPWNFALWNLYFAQEGDYDLWAHVPAQFGESTQAPYTIRHNGVTTTTSHSQADHPDQWMSLGTFHFAVGGDQWVKLVDDTGEPYYSETDNTRIAFDDLRVAPAGTCQCDDLSPPQTQDCPRCGTQTRQCTACQWPDWSGVECVDTGDCAEGETQQDPVGCRAGTYRERTCLEGCVWGDWSVCDPPSPEDGVGPGPDGSVYPDGGPGPDGSAGPDGNPPDSDSAPDGGPIGSDGAGPADPGPGGDPGGMGDPMVHGDAPGATPMDSGRSASIDRGCDCQQRPGRLGGALLAALAWIGVGRRRTRRAPWTQWGHRGQSGPGRLANSDGPLSG